MSIAEKISDLLARRFVQRMAQPIEPERPFEVEVQRGNGDTFVATVVQRGQSHVQLPKGAVKVTVDGKMGIAFKGKGGKRGNGDEYLGIINNGGDTTGHLFDDAAQLNDISNREAVKQILNAWYENPRNFNSDPTAWDKNSAEAFRVAEKNAEDLLAQYGALRSELHRNDNADY